MRGWIRDKCPEQLKLPYVLWTAGVVRELIWRRLHKRLGLSTVQLYLRRWEFTPQKPLTPGDAAFRCRDRGVAEARLSEDRASGAAGAGADLLGR